MHPSVYILAYSWLCACTITALVSQDGEHDYTALDWIRLLSQEDNLANQESFLGDIQGKHLTDLPSQQLGPLSHYQIKPFSSWMKRNSFWNSGSGPLPGMGSRLPGSADDEDEVNPEKPLHFKGMHMRYGRNSFWNSGSGPLPGRPLPGMGSRLPGSADDEDEVNPKKPLNFKGMRMRYGR